MGLLTSTQLGLIPSARIAQKWVISVPYVAGSATFTDNTIHDETDGSVITVEQHGSRANSVGNISPKSFGTVETMQHEITVNNADGKFYREDMDSSSFLYSYGVGFPYMAMPRECFITHYWYVRDGSSWSELPGSPWVGKIADIVYDDVRQADGTWVPGTATIIAEAASAVALREPWHTDHSYDTLVSSSYTPSGFGISSVTTGRTAGGNVWLQATSDVACKTANPDHPVATFRYNAANSNTPAAYGTSATLHRFEDTSPPATWSNCHITLKLTRNSDGAVIAFWYPVIPYVSAYQANAARPW